MRIILITICLLFCAGCGQIEPLEKNIGSGIVAQKIGDRTIEYIHSDDNTNEDLIIKSDDDSYSGLGLFHINFSIENISKDSQNINISIPLVENKLRKIRSIKKFVRNDSIFTATSTEIIPATTSTIEYELTTPAITEINPIWLDLISGKSNTYSVLEKKSTIDRVAEDYFADYIEAGEILYYELILDYGNVQIEDEEFFIEVFGNEGAYGLLDPTITTIDKFNSDTKSTGDLNGQDGWTGSEHFDVQNSIKQEGDQAVINTTAPGGPDRFVELPITARTSGIFSFWLRRDSEGSGTNQLYVILEDGATQHSTIRMDTASNAVLFQGTGTALQNIGTWTVSEWGHAEIRVDNVAETIEGRWNDGEWTEHSRAFTEIDQIHVGAYNDEAIDLYIDNITYNDGIDVVAKPQTSNIITFDNF